MIWDRGTWTPEVDDVNRALIQGDLKVTLHGRKLAGSWVLSRTRPNHASYLDAVALLAALPMEFAFVAKRELASSPLIGAVIRKTGHLPVERADPVQSAADAERATTRLRGGTSLLFFPEGTFVRTPGLLPLRLGAFKAAVEAGRPVIPIGLRGTRDILPDGTWLPRPGPITVAIGPPVTPEASGWQEMVRLRDLTRSELARLTAVAVTADSSRQDPRISVA